MGASLIGSLVVGILQFLTFVPGIKGLLLIVVGIYFLAWLARHLVTPLCISLDEDEFVKNLLGDLPSEQSAGAKMIDGELVEA